MLRRLGRLFVIKNRWEAFAVIYALALGSVDRGFHYMERFPGVGGWLMFAACTGVVFMAGAKLLDHTKGDTGARRRSTDAVPEADRDPAVRPGSRPDRHSSSPDPEEGIAGQPRAATWMFGGAGGRRHDGKDLRPAHPSESPALSALPRIVAVEHRSMLRAKKALSGSAIGLDGE